jgi:hypothetical protein
VPPAEAAEFANFAAAVTVQKLFQTGTASAAEIIEIGKDPDYIYQPELAADTRSARYFNGTEIELCCESIPSGRIKHAVFDHDGTISTLRQGWEEIMAPVMIKAILGDKYVISTNRPASRRSYKWRPWSKWCTNSDSSRPAKSTTSSATRKFTMTL